MVPANFRNRICVESLISNIDNAHTFYFIHCSASCHENSGCRGLSETYDMNGGSTPCTCPGAFILSDVGLIISIISGIMWPPYWFSSELLNIKI